MTVCHRVCLGLLCLFCLFIVSIMGTNPVCLSVFYRDSLQKGWEMIAICLYFFPPSTKFSGYLEGIIAKHLDETNNIIQTEVGNGRLSAEAVLSLTVFRLQELTLWVHGFISQNWDFVLFSYPFNFPMYKAHTFTVYGYLLGMDLYLMCKIFKFVWIFIVLFSGTSHKSHSEYM